MTVTVDVQGRRYAVDVTPRDGAFLVSIDGQPRDVDVRGTGDVLSFLVGSRSYEVSVARTADDVMTVHVDGVPVDVSVVPSRPSWGKGAAAAHSGGEGPQRVTAPMPGKIVKLLVKPGDRVEPRQGLVVVEAMKMENELRARSAGTVSEVRVAEGSSVEAGAILVILE